MALPDAPYAADGMHQHRGPTCNAVAVRAVALRERSGAHLWSALFDGGWLIAFACAMATMVNFCWDHHDLYKRLLAEQAAFGAVFKMTFDAGFWVASDGDTI
eukprot:3353185-Heterocapsa_arctica.AAC.1